jgi:hypothetical protein
MVDLTYFFLHNYIMCVLKKIRGNVGKCRWSVVEIFVFRGAHGFCVSDIG